jgi:hypothetical protein
MPKSAHGLFGQTQEPVGARSGVPRR